MSVQKDAKVSEANILRTRSSYQEQNNLSEIYYKNDHEKAGRAIIFNQIKFDVEAHDEPLSERSGAKEDATNLKNILDCYGFEVEEYTDKTTDIINEILKTVSKSDLSKYNCLIVIMMSHGDENKNVYTHDGPIEVDVLWKYFTGDRCPSLCGKPKLFFIQACRGSTPDFGALIDEQKRFNKIQKESLQNIANSVQSIPIMADILVMFSSADGFPSFREAHCGSWFVEALCEELKKHLYGSNDADLMAILTGVNRYVAFSKEAFDPDSDYHGHKQMPVIMSMLTKIFNLNRKQMKISSTTTDL